jgi:pilus assembly protein CpaB
MQRSLISLIVGVILAVVAIGLFRLYLGTMQPAPAAASLSSMGNVVVAAVDLPFGAQVRPEFLKVAQWPQQSVPAGAFHTVAEIFQGSKGNDRVVLKAISPDEPVLNSEISGFGAKATMSREVTAGMRAASIRIDDVSGVAGFILPGDRVDVMLTSKVESANTGANGGLVTDVILQNITVLGIDQLSDQDRDKPVVARTATVEVTPEQAQKLALAMQVGTLSLALRSKDSTDAVPTTRIQASDLDANGKPVPTPHHSAGGPGVRVIYGTSGGTGAAPASQ